MIKFFKEKYLRITKNCAYDFTLKYIDILRQSSTSVLGGKESLFRIHQDNIEEQQRIVVLVIFQLNLVESSMKIVGGKVFKYSKVKQGVMYMSELWHESIYAEKGTVKIALFYKGTKN